MLNRETTDHIARGDGRERAASARKAAEALFTPRHQALKQPEVRHGLSENPQARQPKILGISAPETDRREEAEPLRPATATAAQKRIADSEAARVRTWVKYGMTIAQAAKVYGVTLIEVQRVLRDR